MKLLYRRGCSLVIFVCPFLLAGYVGIFFGMPFACLSVYADVGPCCVSASCCSLYDVVVGFFVYVLVLLVVYVGVGSFCTHVLVLLVVYVGVGSFLHVHILLVVTNNRDTHNAHPRRAKCRQTRRVARDVW